MKPRSWNYSVAYKHENLKICVIKRKNGIRDQQ